MGRHDKGSRQGMTIRVLIADDQAIVRDVFRFVLERAGDIEIVGMASNGREALEHVTLSSPHVVVMDVSMPVMGGIEATRLIRADHPATKVLMASLHDSLNYIKSSVQAGALGYILKDSAGDELVDAIRSILKGQGYFSKKINGLAQLFLSDTGKTNPISDADGPSPT